jgi:hypothetical protein
MPEEITFEQGYEELTQILDSLEHGEVAVAETVEKCRRAKELERIEAGDQLPEILISAGSVPSTQAHTKAGANGRATGAEDDIPF